MGNYQENIFWSSTHPNLNYTLCLNNTINMWLHQLSTRSNQHIEGILIAQHDTHNSIKRTLINVAKHNSMPQDMIIP